MGIALVGKGNVRNQIGRIRKRREIIRREREVRGIKKKWGRIRKGKGVFGNCRKTCMGRCRKRTMGKEQEHLFGEKPE